MDGGAPYLGVSQQLALGIHIFLQATVEKSVWGRKLAMVLKYTSKSKHNKMEKILLLELKP